MLATGRVYKANFDSCVRGFQVCQDEWMMLVRGKILPYTQKHSQYFALKDMKAGIAVYEVLIQTLHFILSIVSHTILN